MPHCRRFSTAAGTSLHCILTARSATNKLHIGRVNFKGVTRLSIAIGPLFNSQATLDVHRASFSEVLRGSLGLPSPKRYTKPRGLILHLSGFVFTTFVRSHAKAANRSALRCVT